MTRERMATYLVIMSWMESEPVTKFEFELKVNTEKRREYSWQLEEEIKNRFGENSYHSYRYYSKDPRINWFSQRNWDPDLDMEKVTIYAGSWSDRKEIVWLENELKKKKIGYSKVERR